MKIRMLTGIAGIGFSLAPDEETDRFSNADAIRLIEKGYAVPVAESKIETTTLEPSTEKRTRSRSKKSGE